VDPGERVAQVVPAEPVGQVELAEPEARVVRVEPEVPAQAKVPVRVEPAEARDPRVNQVAAAIKLEDTNLPVVAVVVLSVAAVTERPLELQAAGVVPAWAAAVMAAVVAVAAEAVVAAAVVVAAAAVAGVAGKRINSMENYSMKTKLNIMTTSKIFLFGCVLISAGLLSEGLEAAAPAKSDAATGTAKQKEFNTPKEAADSLVQAAETFDVPTLTEILGPESKDVLTSADPVEDKNRAVAFAAKAKEKSAIGTDAKNPNRAILTVGNDDFPLPIPIVKNKGKWMFDMKTGRQEILNRRVGANELDAIAVCRGFVEAQAKYAQEKHDDSKVNQYAQRIISSPGKHDGLAWQNSDGTWGGPVGEAAARAIEQGYSKQGQPFHGYYFKVLKKQGPAAPLGEMDFMVKDAMIGGFALAAAPAQYRVTGVKSFIVGSNGVVYEKDLGADTLKTFEAMDKFNPDKTWKPTDDDWPESTDEAADTQ
jgi:hypothetical protein